MNHFKICCTSQLNIDVMTHILCVVLPSLPRGGFRTFLGVCRRVCRLWWAVVKEAPKDPGLIPHAMDIVRRGIPNRSDRLFVASVCRYKFMPSRCAELFHWRFEKIVQLRLSWSDVTVAEVDAHRPRGDKRPGIHVGFEAQP